MIDISEKDTIIRIAVASGKIKFKKETVERIKAMKVEKGDALTIAKVSAINAVKKVPDLIPFCHPIPISNVQTEAKIHENYIEVEISVRGSAKTGVEMEALVAVSTYLLTIWDMVKKVEKDADGQFPETSIENIRVKEKKKAKT